jgi:hypothetical protein
MRLSCTLALYVIHDRRWQTSILRRYAFNSLGCVTRLNSQTTSCGSTLGLARDAAGSAHATSTVFIAVVAVAAAILVAGVAIRRRTSLSGSTTSASVRIIEAVEPMDDGL